MRVRRPWAPLLRTSIAVAALRAGISFDSSFSWNASAAWKGPVALFGGGWDGDDVLSRDAELLDRLGSEFCEGLVLAQVVAVVQGRPDRADAVVWLAGLESLNLFSNNVVGDPALDDEDAGSLDPLGHAEERVDVREDEPDGQAERGGRDEEHLPAGEPDLPSTKECEHAAVYAWRPRDRNTAGVSAKSSKRESGPWASSSARGIPRWQRRSPERPQHARSGYP